MENNVMLTNIVFADEGDKVVLKSGKVFTFVKLKRTKFVGRAEDGALYDIPVSSFERIIEKAPPKKINDSYKKLKKGELFWINHKDSAQLFRFVEIKNGRIQGINVVDGGKTRIDINLYGGTLEELKF